jgi:hypothetical protein
MNSSELMSRFSAVRFAACYLGRCPRLFHLRTFGADHEL